MSFLTSGLLFFILTFFVNSEASSPVSGVLPQDIIDIIKNFELCDVKCSGKSCECCQKITAPFNVEVCGSSLLRVAEKSVDLTLKMEGDTIASTAVKLDRLLNYCIPVKTKGGKLGICIVTSLNNDETDHSAVDICVNVDVSVEGVNFVHAAFNCAKFDGDIQIEGETSKGLKTYGSVKVVNGQALSNFVHRLVFGN